jgi:hypothetical protein
MVALNIITEIKDGKYKRYQLYENEAKFILNLLRSYYPNIWDKWSMRIVEMFLSLSINREKE